MSTTRGKKYLEAENLRDPDRLYQAQEAISLLKKMNYAKGRSSYEAWR
jgi:hypothetical protein